MYPRDITNGTAITNEERNFLLVNKTENREMKDLQICSLTGVAKQHKTKGLGGVI